MNEYALASFAAQVGERFELGGTPAMTWTLVAADGYGVVVDPGSHRSFSLSFRGPPDPALAQQMVTLTHPTLGELAIFVTPIARDVEDVTYEAVFN